MMGDGISMQDADFRVLYQNQAHKNMIGSHIGEYCYTENRDKIALLLFDVIMPKKNGQEAYDEIRKVKPDVKCIFTSGYASNVVQEKGVLQRNTNFISKPVSPPALLKKVRGVLNT